MKDGSGEIRPTLHRCNMKRSVQSISTNDAYDNDIHDDDDINNETNTYRFKSSETTIASECPEVRSWNPDVCGGVTSCSEYTFVLHAQQW